MVAEIPMPNIVDIYRQYATKLSTIFYKATKNRADAEDLTQITFEKLARNLHRFDGRASFETWLYHIAWNVKVDYFRKKKSERYERHTEFEEGDNFNTNHNPENETMAREAETNLKHFLTTQHPDSVQALVLDLEGLSDQEISNLQRTAVDTVKTRLHRIRRRLKEYLQE
jgi:RNA polymerase sigma-70 factor (ECF subfamily)